MTHIRGEQRGRLLFEVFFLVLEGLLDFVHDAAFLKKAGRWRDQVKELLGLDRLVVPVGLGTACGGCG